MKQLLILTALVSLLLGCTSSSYSINYDGVYQSEHSTLVINQKTNTLYLQSNQDVYVGEIWEEQSHDAELLADIYLVDNGHYSPADFVSTAAIRFDNHGKLILSMDEPLYDDMNGYAQTLHLNPIETKSHLQDIEGMLTPSLNASMTSIVISKNGNFTEEFSESLLGCAVYGQFTPTPHYFSVAAQAEGCFVDYQNGEYQGVAFISNNQLTRVMNNDSSIQWDVIPLTTDK